MHEMRIHYNLEEANEAIPTLEYLFSELGRVQHQVNSVRSVVVSSSTAAICCSMH